MAEKGSLHGQFWRAIERRHLMSAEAVARDLGRLSLADALALLLLIAEQDRERFGRAAARWHGRFVLEARAIGLVDSQLALAAVAALQTEDETAASAIRELGRRYRIANLDSILRHAP